MSRSALLLIDVQYSFLPPDGSLAVPQGTEILPVIHQLLDSGKWDLVVASQDYHPAGHISFASRHDRPPFTSLRVPLPRPPHFSGEWTPQEKEQELWPDHCVQGTRGAELEEGVRERLERFGDQERVRVVRKGTDKDTDAYSAFDPLSPSGSGTSLLGDLLLERGITHLYLCGLATDFCIRATALSALSFKSSSGSGTTPWQVYIIRPAVRGVSPQRSEEVLRELEREGAKVVGMESDEEGGYREGGGTEDRR